MIGFGFGLGLGLGRVGKGISFLVLTAGSRREYSMRGDQGVNCAGAAGMGWEAPLGAETLNVLLIICKKNYCQAGK